MATGSDSRHRTGIGRRGFLKAFGAVALVPALGTRPTAGRGMPATAGTSSAPATAVLARAGATPVQDRARWEACLRAARAILLVGPGGEDLKLQYLRVLIDDGLPRTDRPRRVLIVGAGMAGLTAGLLLKQAGHDVTIIEANANRIGGRVKTFRSDPAQGLLPPFGDPRQYAEAGAMRIPDFHPLTLALIDRLGLRRRLFYNVDVRPGTGNEDAPVPAVTYQAFDGTVWRRGAGATAFRAPDQARRTWIRTNDQQVRRGEYAADPRTINGGFSLPATDVRRTTADLLDAAVDPVRDYFSERTPGGGRRDRRPVSAWVEGWARLLYDLDHYSMWGFLKGPAGLSDQTIEAIGTLENLTSRLPLSFIHSFQELATINPQSTYWEIEGGSWRLPYALLPMLKDRIRMNRRMTRIEYTDPSRDGGPGPLGLAGPAVRIQTVSEPGATHGGLGISTETFTGDVAIITIPFSSLRHVEVAPLFSLPKRRAIIELHYDSATKVLLEFSRRWWEFDEDGWRRELHRVRPGLYEEYAARRQGRRPNAEPAVPGALGADGAVPERQRAFHAHHATASLPEQAATGAIGGGSLSDNPNRFMYYPSHPVPGSPGGVVLASYTWADDASRWDSMDDDERYVFALRGLQEVHGERIEVFYTGHGQTQSWMRDPYAFGEAAVLAPGQLSQFQPTVAEPEGVIHFAGEHTSVKHAWIEGALESAVRAALEVNGATTGVATGGAAATAVPDERPMV
jgi:monoamine oxidase